MIINGATGVSHVMIAFVGLSILLIGGLLVRMHLRHQYRPGLIGALIGALCCFVLLEALPALT